MVFPVGIGSAPTLPRSHGRGSRTDAFVPVHTAGIAAVLPSTATARHLADGGNERGLPGVQDRVHHLRINLSNTRRIADRLGGRQMIPNRRPENRPRPVRDRDQTPRRPVTAARATIQHRLIGWARVSLGVDRGRLHRLREHRNGVLDLVGDGETDRERHLHATLVRPGPRMPQLFLRRAGTGTADRHRLPVELMVGYLVQGLIGHRDVIGQQCCCQHYHRAVSG